MTDAANEPFVDEDGNELSCPRCGAKSGLSIQGDVTGIWATVQADGTLKYDVTAHEGFVYGGSDPAHCTHCDWAGSAGDLTDNDPPPPLTPTQEVLFSTTRV